MSELKENNEAHAMKQWVLTWKRASKKLEAIRLAELSELDTPKALEAFFGLVSSACSSLPPRTDSGLVEQQQLFRKMRQL